MVKKKRLGIWINHSDAHLMEFRTDIVTLNTIESTFTNQEETVDLDNDKRKQHKKEKQKHEKFYKELSETIKYYDEVVIFGDTEAKDELVDILQSDNQFADIKIDVQTTDKLSESQQHIFVKDHFLKNGDSF